MKRLFLISLLSLSFLTLFDIASVLAQPATPPSGSTSNPPTGSISNPIGIKIENPFSGEPKSLFDLMKNILDKLVLPLGAILCVLAFIYAGFKFVMAQGDEKALGEAKKMLLYAVIGTVILLGATLLTSVICETVKLLGAKNINCSSL